VYEDEEVSEQMKDDVGLSLRRRCLSCRVSTISIGAFLIVALLLLAGCSQSGGSNPNAGSNPTATTSSSSGTVQPLSMIRMFSPSNGWALSTQAVLFTTDGGKSWKDVTPPRVTITPDATADFYSTNLAWVALPPEKNIIHIYSTINEGKSWTPSSFAVNPGTTTASQLFFVDPQHGWLLSPTAVQSGSEAVVIYRTTNGGGTWREVSVARPDNAPNAAKVLPFSGDKQGISFVNDSTGWVAGTIPKSDTVWLYVTHDGGSTWQPQFLSLPSNVKGAQITTLPPRFFSSSSGILPVLFLASNGARTADFYQTTDGGTTWKSTSTLTLSSVIRSFINLNQGWVTDDTNLYMTQNGGHSWTQLNPNMSLKGVTHLDFVTNQIGYAISGAKNGSPFLLQTTDGGNSWTTVKYSVNS
jgi:photosystem II stability/assembly factor-like uncharacterized protein